jgi:rSAM/selenodomain-associated transferase 2
VRLSVVVPTLDEEAVLAATLGRVRDGDVHELIVVDGGSRDSTRAVAARFTERILVTEPGRARQMNAGAAVASGDVLLFLHADTLMPNGFARAIARALADHAVIGGRFDVRLDGTSRWLPLIAAAINMRSRLTKVATGDQAIFVRRAVFDGIGGFPLVPLLEDVRFTTALKRRGKVACLRERVATSARRWDQRGVTRTVVLMWVLRLGNALGVAPERLQRFYAAVR